MLREVLVVALVVSSLVVRVVAGDGSGGGFRLMFEGEIAGEFASEPKVESAGSTVAVVIAALHGAARAEARGLLGSIMQGRFRVESGRLGGAGPFDGAGDYSFRLALGQAELYAGTVTIVRLGAGFAVAADHLLDSATLWFDDGGTADAPMLACSFWCAAGATGGDPVAELLAALYYNGRPILSSRVSGRGVSGSKVSGPGVSRPGDSGVSSAAGDSGASRRAVELRVVDVLGGPGPADVFRRVQLRFPGARAFVLGQTPGAHDLSAHPGVYGIRVTRGRELMARVPFEIDGHGVLRESGPVECRADGVRVMLLGGGRRYGPPPDRGAATLDPVYARYFAAIRPPAPLALDVAQRWALDGLLSDLARSVGAVDLDAERARATVHELLTRVDELESVVPGRFAVVLGGEEVPFERLREVVLAQLESLGGADDGIPGRPSAFAQGEAS